ncbi:MAG: hypothetical protein COB22_02105 [Cycloclasticus sp.]|nr:MAG: hypothetical protein COB22_02105 [Cycloclasticus sp.]
MKLIYLAVITLMLSACADLSMYNQTPAPTGQPGEASRYPGNQTSSAKTYPIEDPSLEKPLYTASKPQNPAVIALLDGAHQQSNQGQFDLAAVKLERAVRISPRDARVWYELAKVREQQKKYQLAISLAKKSNLLAGDNSNLKRNNWLLIAQCFERLGNEDSASKARANAIR